MLTKFIDTGFLSDEIIKNISCIKNDNFDFFDLSSDINSLLMLIVEKVTRYPYTFFANDNIDICCSSIIRSARIFQGVLLLSERGLSLEANTLTRSLVENGFVLTALAKHPDEVIYELNLIYEDQSRKMELITEREKMINPSKEELDEINSKIKECKRKFSPYKFAKCGGVEKYYIPYDFLSIYYSHSTPNSLFWYKEFKKNDIFNLKYEPSNKSSTRLTLNQSILAILLILKSSSSIIDIEDEKDKLEAIEEKYINIKNKGS